MHASFSVNLYLCLPVCVCVLLSVLFTLLLSYSSHYFCYYSHILLSTLVFFCIPFVFCSCLHTCYRCLLCSLALTVVLCCDSWRSPHHDLHLALSRSLSLYLLLLFSCLSAFIAPCGGASKHLFKSIFYIIYLYCSKVS